MDYGPTPPPVPDDVTREQDELIRRAFHHGLAPSPEPTVPGYSCLINTAAMH